MLGSREQAGLISLLLKFGFCRYTTSDKMEIRRLKFVPTYITFLISMYTYTYVKN